jgi:hypothetical protein
MLVVDPVLVTVEYEAETMLIGHQHQWLQLTIITQPEEYPVSPVQVLINPVEILNPMFSLPYKVSMAPITSLYGRFSQIYALGKYLVFLF